MHASIHAAKTTAIDSCRGVAASHLDVSLAFGVLQNLELVQQRAPARAVDKAQALALLGGGGTGAQRRILPEGSS